MNLRDRTSAESQEKTHRALSPLPHDILGSYSCILPNRNWQTMGSGSPGGNGGYNWSSIPEARCGFGGGLAEGSGFEKLRSSGEEDTP